MKANQIDWDEVDLAVMRLIDLASKSDLSMVPTITRIIDDLRSLRGNHRPR